MPTVRCLICKNPSLLLYVNGLLDKGITNAGIAAGVVDMGGKLDPDVIGRHKNGHWVKPERAEGPKATKGDLAVLVRDKVYDMVDELTPEALMVLGKDFSPVIGQGIKAQTLIDKREQLDKKLGIQAGAIALQAWIAGLGHSPPPPELDDGNTIEGESVELEDDELE